MKLEYVDPINDKRWYTFIEQQNNSNIFHHPEWLKVLNSQYGYKIIAICNVNNGIILAGIPFCIVHSLTNKRKLISLPFSDYCNPLFSCDKEIKEVFLETKILYKTKRIDSVEICYSTPDISGFNSVVDSYLHLLDIKENEEKMMKSFDRTKRQGIAKAEKQGLEVVLSKELPEVLSFFNLHLMTRKAKGVPVQPIGFFKKIYEHIIKNNLGFVILVKKDNVDIAGGLFMHYNKVLTYKYNASHSDYLHLRPNNLIVWRALQYGIHEGFKIFDFGKTDLDNEGLRRFKCDWGAVDLQNKFSYYPAVPEPGILTSIKDKIVAPVIKTCPSFVCQFIGEMGYKYYPSI
ncbi:MAG: lipid II:glycine glycyltransferase FemX [Methanococcaceae archaeon]